VDVRTTAELQQALAQWAPASDVVIMAAAVADFRPATAAAGKLSRRTGGAATTLTLTSNPDLLAGLAQARGAAHLPFLVGFAAESAGGDGTLLVERAAAKLVEKGCEAMIANDISQAGIGFGADDNAVTVIFADGTHADLQRASKTVVADGMWTLLVPRLASRPSPQPADRKTRPTRVAS
jgi:phosphopantothenoylcysteine decarboxylase/phosphopantothenate--cysteine ligase